MSVAELSLRNNREETVRETSGVVTQLYRIRGKTLPEDSNKSDALEIIVQNDMSGRVVKVKVPDVKAEKPTVEIIDTWRAVNEEANLCTGGIKVALDFIAEHYNVHEATLDGPNITRADLSETLPVLQPLELAA